MIKRVSTLTKALVFTTLVQVLSTSQASRNEPASGAHACDTLSPSHTQLGEQYFNLAPEPVTLPALDSARLNDLYASLTGRWEGQWTDHYCVGSGESARLRSKSRSFKRISANVREHGQLSFRADGLTIDLANASALTSLEIVDDHTVVMTRRYQRGTAPGYYWPSRQVALRERHDTLTVMGKQLQLQTKWYINGYYSGTEFATMNKAH